MSYYIVLFGSPGSGKGTQADLLSKKFSLPILSTGHLLREEVASGSAVGSQVAYFIEEGSLVPDDYVLKVYESGINEQRLAKGFISDGFPRNIFQCGAFDTIVAKGSLEIKIFFLDLSLIFLKERLLNRRECKKCSLIYHMLYAPPKKGEICDHCNSNLVKRSDDNERTIEKRYQVFQDELSLIKAYYADRFIYINASREPSKVFEDILGYLDV